MIALAGVLVAAATGPAAAELPCELPGSPDDRAHYRDVGFSWCPVEIDLQARRLAILAAEWNCIRQDDRWHSTATVKKDGVAGWHQVQFCEDLAAAAVDGCACPAEMYDGADELRSGENL